MLLHLILAGSKLRIFATVTIVDVLDTLLLNVEPDELTNNPTKEIIIEEMTDVTKDLALVVMIDLIIKTLLEKEKTLEKEADTQTHIIITEEELVFAYFHPIIEMLIILDMMIFLLPLLLLSQENRNNSLIILSFVLLCLHTCKKKLKMLT